MSIENQSDESTVVNNGSWKAWDRIWVASDGSENQQMFIKGTPVTRRQFRMQGYFKDLWAMMGEGAESKKYLELGAGRGTISMYLADKQCDVTLLDLSREGLDLAEKNFASSGLAKPNTVIADATNSGLEPESFDCIYNIGLLEHFEDPLPLLTESMRLLRPGGLLFQVIVPEIPRRRMWPIQLAMNPLMTTYRIARSAAARLIKGKRKKDVGSMLRTDYREDEWVEWMKTAGGKDVHCIPYNAYHQLYQTKVLQDKITMPLFRSYYGMKTRFGNAPYLKTMRRLACAQLLYCTK